jgi:hypothetical protein
MRNAVGENPRQDPYNLRTDCCQCTLHFYCYRVQIALPSTSLSNTRSPGPSSEATMAPSDHQSVRMTSESLETPWRIQLIQAEISR